MLLLQVINQCQKLVTADRASLFLVDKKGGRKFAKMMKDYDDAMQKAKKHHLNIWRYGDITDDDAKEFGVGVKPAR